MRPIASTSGTGTTPTFLVAVTVVPTKSFATVGGIIEINLIALTNAATREKQVIETDIPGMAAYGPCIRSVNFCCRRADSDWSRRPCRRQDDLTRLWRTGSCRAQPGGGDLRLCRSVLP